MAPDGFAIVGLGASTPLGRNVWASAAAARAGVSGFSEHPFMIDTVGEPMRVARAPWLDVTLAVTERYGELLFPAVDEALRSAGNSRDLGEARVGLAIALPPGRPGRPVDLVSRTTEAVTEQYPGRFSKVLTFEYGHAAGYVALDAAVRSLGASSTDACVVAGVDSYLAPDTLEWIEECDQFHGAGALNNAWGFVPGEGAGAVLVTTRGFANNRGLVILAEIVGVGLGRETKLIKTDDVCLGEGLTQAFRGALSALAPQEQVHNVFCDLNGETYRADEYGFTSLRTKDRLRAATDFVAPADCWGDVGAASAPLHVALAAISHHKRYAKGATSMSWASSEGGERGATVIRAVDASAS